VNRSELAEILRHGESSGVEFKRDEVHADDLAKEMVALLNFEGGQILLGIEDNGTISGLTRTSAAAEEWVMNVGRSNLQPAIIPFWETLNLEDGKVVGVITLPGDSPDKPYKAKRGKAWTTFVRVGTTSREATREEEGRLYQASGLVRYDLRPVPGSEMQDLDRRRLENYFRDVRGQEIPAAGDADGWRTLLVNTDLLVESHGKAIPTTGAILLFGVRPSRFLPQCGVSAAAYIGKEKDYAARERVVLKTPLTPLLDRAGESLENGLVDQVMEFVRRNTTTEAWIGPDGRRQDRWKDYPLEAVREAVVNALAHRDYSITVTDIELSIYQDRLEVVSPGRLPNGVTVEKMKHGYRATRNELIKEVLRDYRYIEATGLGVPRKIVRGMREHNGTEPELFEEESRFTVRLVRENPARAATPLQPTC
jgi:ATP-dependent DNA helicase RecG